MKNFFKLQIFLLLVVTFMSGNSFAQQLNESFTGATFPPAGWTTVHVAGTGGLWARNTVTPRTAPACALAPFSSTGAQNWLISKRVNVLATESGEDSLIFWYRHTYTPAAGTADTFTVKTSSTDSLVPSFSTTVLNLPWTSTGATGVYARYAVKIPSGTKFIAFRHVDIDGDDIRIDDITLGKPANNEITISNEAPLDSTNTNDTYAPRATFTNTGLLNQTNFDVTYTITSPSLAVYSSTKNIASLNSGSSISVTFDSTFTPVDTGNYSVNISSSVGDLPPVSFVIKIIAKNWGLQAAGGCCYWWANSQAVWNNTRPTFSWKNPNVAGAVVLANNGVATTALSSGTLDDGFWNRVNILTGKKIKYCGSIYSSIYPATNGNIGLAAGSTAFTVGWATGPAAPAILPLFMDLDMRIWSAANPTSLSYVVTPNELVITYLRARRYTAGGVIDTNDFVSFQTCIELVDDTDPNAPNSNIRFNYWKAGTSTTFLNTSTGAANSNTVSNQLVGLRPPANPAIIYRQRNQPPFATSVFPVNVTGPIFGGLADKATDLSVEFGQCGRNLNILNSRWICFKVFFEGYRLASIPSSDTVTISARGQLTPHPIIESQRGKTDNTGWIWLRFDYLYGKNFYWYTVQQKSAIRTWSQLLPGPSTDTLTYNLTTSTSQAYGSNQALVSGAAAMFSGDVNQNGVVDVADISAVDNDAFNFVGGYISTDVNGDMVVDVSDLSITDNNAFNFVGEVAPPGPVSNESLVSPFINLPDGPAFVAPDANDIEKMNMIKYQESGIDPRKIAK